MTHPLHDAPSSPDHFAIGITLTILSTAGILYALVRLFAPHHAPMITI